MIKSLESSSTPRSKTTRKVYIELGRRCGRPSAYDLFLYGNLGSGPRRVCVAGLTLGWYGEPRWGYGHREASICLVEEDCILFFNPQMMIKSLESSSTPRSKTTRKVYIELGPIGTLAP